MRQIVRDDLRQRQACRTADPLPARAQRLPAHRPRQGDLPELRHRRGVRRRSATCASTTPTRPAKTRNSSQAIQDDVRWLGFDWAELRHASDYFEVFYLAAEKLIAQGDAFVCDLSAEEVRDYRGTLTEPGRNSPYRDRSRRGEPGPVPAHARGRVRRRRAHAAREDRHGQRQHQPARPGAVPHQARSRTRTPATPGRSTRCTTTRIRSATRSRASRIRCARWSSRTTGRCTTGASTRSTWRNRRSCWRRCWRRACRTRPASRARSSSRASTSTTR